MQLFKSMIIGICLVSISAAISGAMVKKGGVHEVIKIVSGIMVILLFVTPITKAQFDFNIPVISQNIDFNEELFKKDADYLYIKNICNEISLHIMNELKKTGIDCTVTVSAQNKGGELDILQVIISISAENSRKKQYICEFAAKSVEITKEKIIIIEDL